MTPGPTDPYYRADLAHIHHLGFAKHADDCAAGILALLKPVRERGGLVLELGCGSGLLTRHLVAAGHQVIATDASPAMLELARGHLDGAGATEIRQLVLPDDPLPEADAVVSVGHVLNYLPTATAIDLALTSAARALLPGGVLALDLCDLAWAEARRGSPPHVHRHDEWFLVTEFATPVPDLFVREMTTFVRNPDGWWRRDDERHANVLIDTARVPALLAAAGVDAHLGTAFGNEVLPAGLVTVIGRRHR